MTLSFSPLLVPALPLLRPLQPAFDVTQGVAVRRVMAIWGSIFLVPLLAFIQFAVGIFKANKAFSQCRFIKDRCGCCWMMYQVSDEPIF